MKVLLTAGGGGHTGYALALGQALKQKALLTFLIDEEDSLSKDRLSPIGKIVAVRKPRHPRTPLLTFIYRFVLCSLQSFWIWIKHRPDVVVSTGSNIAIPISIIGKALGSRIVNAEDSVRIFSASKTSRYLDLISDLTLLQWKEQLKFHSKKGKYVGLLLPDVAPSTRNGRIIISPGSFGFKELYDIAVKTDLKNVTMTIADLNVSEYRKPGWVVVNKLIGLDEVLASARVLVTHLGYTIWEALNYHVPVVIVPNPKWRRSSVHEMEQVAFFIQERGFGLYLPFDGLTPEKLQESVAHAERMDVPPIERGSEEAARLILEEEE
jgi:UDP-N-acetylglucosamine--N-acetylmuramyl-(pentapeptide) pyrophosphoryl-undecaprenol N-acetylglucosamine transferase